MLIAFLVFSVLILIDLIMLKIMPGFYFFLGIPFFKGRVLIRPDNTLNDVGVFLGISENFVYKIKGDVLIYRTKFTYSNLYRIGFLSLVKGNVTIKEGYACFVQRINLTTIYMFSILVYLFATLKIDLVGYIIAAVILALAVLFHFARISEIGYVMKDIRENINREKKVKSRWGD